MICSYFKNAKDKISERKVSVEEIVELVKNPTPEVKDTLNQAREALAAGGKEDYKKIKEGLPAVSFSGVFEEIRNKESLTKHSGLMQIDFDHLESDQLIEAKRTLTNDPHVLFLYVSPSGSGLKGAVVLDRTPSNDQEHKVAFTAVRNYMRTNGLAMDECCKEVCRLAFLSWDEECFFNVEALPLAVEEWRDITDEEKEVERLQCLLELGYMASIKTPPPDCPVILQTDESVVIGEAGNIITLEAQMKAGKTALLGGIIAAAISPTGAGDFLGFDVPVKSGFVMHFDCEQSSKGHYKLIERAVRRAGLSEIPAELKSWSLLHAPVVDRWPMCQSAAESLSEIGPLRIVIFDGGADFLHELNDEAASRSMVEEMHRFALKRRCLVIIVIHENAGSENGKTRGHFGSELWRKAQSCIGITKNATDQISCVYGKLLRDGEWSKSQGHYFRYCAEKGMHITCSDPSATRKVVQDEIKQSKRQELARAVVAGDGMSHTSLWKAIMKYEGVSDKTAKNRITEMVKLGILIKREDGLYELSK